MQHCWGRAGLICLLFVAHFSWAATAVDVTGVRFNSKRLTGVPNDWVEAEITLRPARSTEPAEDVDVTLLVNYRTPRGQYAYKGKCSLYILEDTSVVRFYLPGDVVKAYSLTRTPESYLVEVSSSMGKEEYSSRMGSPTMLNAQRRSQLISTAAVLPDSQALLPIYNTPFYALSENWRDLPSYVIP